MLHLKLLPRDNDGYCALHLCQMGESSVMNYIEKLELLMNTGNFTGMERNSMGITPIRIVWGLEVCPRKIDGNL